MVDLTTALSTPVGLVVPGTAYDLTLTHDGHTHDMPSAAVRAFYDDDGTTIRYEAQIAEETIGFLAEQVTAATQV